MYFCFLILPSFIRKGGGLQNMMGIPNFMAYRIWSSWLSQASGLQPASSVSVSHSLLDANILRFRKAPTFENWPYQILQATGLWKHFGGLTLAFGNQLKEIMWATVLEAGYSRFSDPHACGSQCHAVLEGNSFSNDVWFKAKAWRLYTGLVSLGHNLDSGLDSMYTAALTNHSVQYRTLFSNTFTCN